MFFLSRWIYSDTDHAKNIEVLTYLLTDEQVAYMLSHPNEVVHQPSNTELRLKNVNTVLRIRNLTNEIAFGKLLWCMPDEAWGIVEIHYIPTPEQSKRYSNIVIPMGLLSLKRNDSPPDPITVKWDELYVYR